VVICIVGNVVGKKKPKKPKKQPQQPKQPKQPKWQLFVNIQQPEQPKPETQISKQIEMKICSLCGKKIKKDVLFCEFCGEKQ